MFIPDRTHEKHSTRMSEVVVDSTRLGSWILTVSNTWEESKKFQNMLTAQRYYENNPDINLRERKVIGECGVMQTAPYLANNKLSHPFLKKLVRQKVGYLLSKPFTITSTNEDFKEAVMKYFTVEFLTTFKNTGKDSIVKGIGWLQPYYDEKGILMFRRIPSTEIRPFWDDIEHTVLGGAIRKYKVDKYTENGITQEVRFQYFTKERIYNFIETTDVTGITKLIPDPIAPWEYSFYLKYSTATTAEGDLVAVAGDEDIRGVMWDRIPLIAVKYNSEEQSLLDFVKSLIDDYDARTSDLANAIEEEPNKIKVVKNYDGTDKNEFVKNVATLRTIFVRENGEFSTIDNSLNVTAVNTHLDRLREDIYEFGGGVDTQKKDLSSSSGPVLRYLYSDVDSDSADFGNELTSAIQSIAWFIQKDLELQGIIFDDEPEIEVVFNTDIIINEGETITNLKNSEGMTSRKTILENHPYVKNATLEMKQIEAEFEQKLKEQAKILELESRFTEVSTQDAQE